VRYESRTALTNLLCTYVSVEQVGFHTDRPISLYTLLGVGVLHNVIFNIVLFKCACSEV
jgi:hypothetical protein